jgi:MFS family permease
MSVIESATLPAGLRLGELEPAPADARVATKSRAWMTRFAVMWFGLWMANLVPLQLLLPNRLEQLDAAHKIRDFGVINGVTGGLALLALPLLGAWCDRSRSRHGRRRVWAATGVGLLGVGLVLTGMAQSVVGIGAGWLVATMGVNVAMTGLTAAIADGVPGHQRGTASAAMYAPQAPASLLGLAVLSTVGGPAIVGYLFLATVVLACSGPFLSAHRDAPGPVPGPMTVRNVLGALWIDPRRHRDFAWAFGGRLLVNLGNALATSYLLFFLTDDLRLADPEAGLLQLTAIYLASTLAVTWAAGRASDRSGRRRIFVAAGAALQASGALALVIAPAMSTAVVAAALLGAGYGAYLSVDQALVSEVLPDAASRAKDLGIINIGYLVPQAAGPLLASLIIAQLGGYPTLFAAAGVTTALGAASVQRIRGVA